MPQPNLTLDRCGGVMVGQNDPRERYNGLDHCSKERNIPVAVLKLCKASDTVPHHGFCRNGKVIWQDLQPYLSEHYHEYLAATLVVPDDEREKLELRKLAAEVTKLENYNKTKSKDFISRKLVLKTVNSLYANVFSQLSRYLLQEMPAKCDGMTANQLKAYNKEYLSRLLSGLKNMESVWGHADDIKEEDSAPVGQPQAEATDAT